MIRIRFTDYPLPAYFAVSVVRTPPHTDALVGYVWLDSNGRWIARGHSASVKDTVGGWLRRSDAARFLLIDGGYAEEPRGVFNCLAVAA